MSTHATRVSTPGGFSGLPFARLGGVSAIAFAVGVVLVVLIGTVLGSVDTSIGNLDVGGALAFAVMLAALVTVATALIRDRERSWLVWVSTVLPAIVLGIEVILLLVGGE